VTEGCRTHVERASRSVLLLDVIHVAQEDGPGGLSYKSFSHHNERKNAIKSARSLSDSFGPPNISEV
jgi:hypothetical protein